MGVLSNFYNWDIVILIFGEVRRNIAPLFRGPPVGDVSAMVNVWVERAASWVC